MSDLSNHRRDRQIVLSSTSVLVLGLMLASPAHSAPTVPWLNQPAAEKAAPVSAAVSGTHACASGELRIVAGATGAYRGQATQEVRMTNIGTDACYLTGAPTVQLLPSNEAPQTVGASDASPQLANERVDLAPGDETVILLGAPANCEAATKPERKVSKRLQLALPGGGMKVLEGVHIDTLCGRATVMHLQPLRNEAAASAMAQKLGAALNQLTGTLSAPDEVSRGGILRYIVTISNPTGNPVSLASCPAYTQSLFADGKAAESTLRLNCSAAGAQIDANGSVSFEMQAQVPADFAADSVKLSWKLHDGPAVGKLIDLR
jgi:hypothetical protein